MQKREKQVAAALAAVQLYLQEEEAAAQALLEPAEPVQAAAGDSAWTQTGRMEMMGLRRMMQMRAFARIR